MLEMQFASRGSSRDQNRADARGRKVPGLSSILLIGPVEALVCVDLFFLSF